MFPCSGLSFAPIMERTYEIALRNPIALNRIQPNITVNNGNMR